LHTGPRRPGDAWAEINAGITAQVDRNMALSASGSYEVGFDGRTGAWDGRIGLRANW
jgi:outer membrane autotransporter protein